MVTTVDPAVELVINKNEINDWETKSKKLRDVLLFNTKYLRHAIFS